MSKTLVRYRYNDPQEYRPQLLQRVYKTKLYSKELHCASQLKFYRYVGVFHRAHRWPLQVYIFIGSRKRGDGRWGPAAGRGGAQRYWGIGKPSIRISLAMPSVCIEFRIRNWVLHASLSLNTHTTEAQSPRPIGACHERSACSLPKKYTTCTGMTQDCESYGIDCTESIRARLRARRAQDG